jgi:hypothetical protein
MRRYGLVLSFYFLVFGLCAQNENLVWASDRPGLSFAASPAPKGYFILQSGYEFNRQRQLATDLEDNFSTGHELRYGLSPYFELAVAFSTNYSRDLLVGRDGSDFQWMGPNLWLRGSIPSANKNLSMAVMAQIGSETADARFNIAYNFPGSGWSLSGNFGARSLEESIYFAYLAAGYSWARWSVYGEYFWEHPGLRANLEQKGVNMGGAFMLRPRFQLDIFGGWRQERPASVYRPFVVTGISWCFKAFNS